MQPISFPFKDSPGANSASAAPAPSQPLSTADLIDKARLTLSSRVCLGDITGIEKFFSEAHPQEVIDALTRGDTPVHEAVEMRSPEALAELKKHLPAALNVTNDRGETPLAMAARMGNIPEARVLLGESVSELDNKPMFADDLGSVSRVALDIDLEIRDADGNTPLALAVMHSNVALARLLLEKGANPNAINRFGETLAMLAVMRLNISSLETLGTHGADFNQKNKAGVLPLHYALARDASLDMIRELLWCKADPNLKGDNGDSALMIAVAKKRDALAATKLLLDRKYGVNVNDTNSQLKTTALFDAVKAGNVEVVKLLLDKGANPLAEDIVGNIPRFLVGAYESISVEADQQMQEVLRAAEKANRS